MQQTCFLNAQEIYNSGAFSSVYPSISKTDRHGIKLYTGRQIIFETKYTFLFPLWTIIVKYFTFQQINEEDVVRDEDRRKAKEGTQVARQLLLFYVRVYIIVCRLQVKCGGTRWRTGGKVKGKLSNGVGSQYYSHYLGTWCIQHYYHWCAHLGCQ